MNKIQQLAEYKSRVAELEEEVGPEAQAQIDTKAEQINILFREIEEIAKATGLNPTIAVGGNEINYDGYDWTPGYASDWYSSSADC